MKRLGAPANTFTDTVTALIAVASLATAVGCKSEASSSGVSGPLATSKLSQSSVAKPAVSPPAASTKEEVVSVPSPMAPASFSGGEKVAISNAVGLGCEARAKADWIEILCRKKNGTGGHPKRAIRDLEAFEAEQAAGAPATNSDAPNSNAPNSDALAPGSNAPNSDALAPGSNAPEERPPANSEQTASAPIELPNVVEVDEQGELRLALPWREGQSAKIRIEWTDTVYDLIIEGLSARLVLPVRMALRRECERLRKASAAVVDQARKGDGAEALTAIEASKLPRFGICQGAGLGAWALELETLHGSGTGQARALTANLNVVHVDPDGGLVSAPFAPLTFAPLGLEAKPLMVYDYDDDGQHELIVRYDLVKMVGGAQPSKIPAVYTLQDGKIVPYARLATMGPGSTSVEQLDFDMRPDIADYGPYIAWLPDQCGANKCPGRVVGPRFFSYSQSDGSFSRAHKNALAALKRACPRAPEHIVVAQGKSVDASRTALALGCSKAWGVAAELILAQLDEGKSSICGEAEDCALIAALRSWASIEPPAKL